MFEFQFHIGSIKSYITDEEQMATLLFQFHIGSIKRER